MKRYVIGVDYGTLSGRAVLADRESGEIAAAAVLEYPHGVMDRRLPGGRELPQDWALQHPADYMQVLEETVPRVLRESGVGPEEVAAIGVDCTAATPLPVSRDGTPLCFMDKYKDEPHAYAHLWKHHAAQPLADRMTRLAEERKEPWLPAYGGKVSCETALPKLWQVLEEAPELYSEMAYWIEAADWITWQLCGKPGISACCAGFKYLHTAGGYPSGEYFRGLDPRLEQVMRDKCSLPVIPLFSRAGELTEAAAARIGLRPGTAVAAAGIDAHACLPAVGITEPGQMVMIPGTSACFMICDREYHPVSGCYAVKDGILPGLWCYEAGQNSVGDSFAWMMRSCISSRTEQEAAERGQSVHEYLSEKAARKRPGESGLLALDWFNGNRSVLMDSDLTAMMVGLTLQTAPEDIYRAIAESIVFGARTIVDHLRSSGVGIREVRMTGGISRKNPMMMQMYADVLGMPVSVMSTGDGSALGSAIAAAAAAEPAGGRPLEEVIRRMAAGISRIYTPNAEYADAYGRLYGLYAELSSQMSRRGSAMKELMELKRAASRS